MVAPQQAPRVREIDLLRFIAAAWVTLFHYVFRGPRGEAARSELHYPWLEHFAAYGYLGMELFFMISGFVIPMSARHGSLRRFAVSRILRLYPAFWICCTITFVAILAFNQPQKTATAWQYLVNLTMLSGFVGVASIEGAYWSLFLELRFYLLIALVLAFRQAGRMELFFVLWLAGSILAELLPLDPLRRFLLVEYSAYFVAGGALYFIHANGITRARQAMLACAWAYAMFKTAQNLRGMNQFYDVELSVVVACGVVSLYFVLMLLISSGRTGWFGRRDWMALGALTYPLYLLHQEIGYLIFNALTPMVNAHLLLWGTVAMMLATAWAVTCLADAWTARLRPHVQGVIDLLADWHRTAVERLRTAGRSPG